MNYKLFIILFFGIISCRTNDYLEKNEAFDYIFKANYYIENDSINLIGTITNNGDEFWVIDPNSVINYDNRFYNTLNLFFLNNNNRIYPASINFGYNTFQGMPNLRNYLDLMKKIERNDSLQFRFQYPLEILREKQYRFVIYYQNEYAEHFNSKIASLLNFSEIDYKKILNYAWSDTINVDLKS